MTRITLRHVLRGSFLRGSTIKRWRPQYPNAIYTEVTNDDIETFRATSWRNQQAMPASNAFSAARKIINQIDGLPDVDIESSQAREIMDLSLAFSKVLGCVHGITPGGQQAVAVSNVQIVLPPKSGELSHA